MVGRGAPGVVTLGRVDALRVLVAVRSLQVERSTRRPGSPAELARRLDPTFNVTPTIRLLSDIAVRAVKEPDQRDVVNTPPRTGKSQLLVVWTSVWALMEDPDLEIIIVAYADDLAQEHSRKARKIIRDHSAYLGFSLSLDKTAVGRWSVEGHKGGVLAGGINSGITGMGAGLLLIDDPVKDQAEADSKAHRERVLKEYQSTLAPRVHPGGSTLVVQTRWHERDLAGELLRLEPDVWRHTNIPAVADVKVPDALCRVSGAVMVSALGFTAAHFAARRRTSGERAWYALYMGMPSAPEGGLVKQGWLEAWRMVVPPVSPVLTVVAVDPSDSGEGDSCGLVAVSLTADGVSVLIADESAPMTSDQWASAAVDLAVEVGASRVVVESFAARETYSRVMREAIGRAQKRGALRRSVGVVAWPPKGSGRGQGDAVARSSALLQGLETGTVRLGGHFPDFEARAVVWQAGKHQPDSLAALVVGHDELVHSGGLEWDFAVPGSGPVGGGQQSSASVTGMGDWMSRRVG